MREIYVAEYSKNQNCFHTTIFKKAIIDNYKMVRKKDNNDFLIFGLYKTLEDAQKACDDMKKIHKQMETKWHGYEELKKLFKDLTSKEYEIAIKRLTEILEI